MRRGGPAVERADERPLSYQEFLQAKAVLAPVDGLEISDEDINPLVAPHARAIIRWAVRGGRRAIFASFGLFKTVIQLEIVRLILARTGGRGLIVLPLGVRQEFIRDAMMLATGDRPAFTDEQREGLAAWLGTDKNTTPIPRFIRRLDEADAQGVYLTNYATVRDGKLDPTQFAVIALDEAGVLRGFGGVKTFREFMRHFEGSGKYRFVATATPSPNEFIELLAYAAFLDVMDVSAAKTRFFKRDSEKADHLTLHAHKADEFWQWCATWSVALHRPSDLGAEFSDEGFALPPLTISWHELPSDHSAAAPERDGQGRMFRDAAFGVSEASKEKRASLDDRIRALTAMVPRDVGQFIVWVDLNAEQRAAEQALDALGISYSSLDGAMPEDERETRLEAFRDGTVTAFISKPMMYGAGVNLQQCAREIFLGIGFKFNDVIQAVHRCYRFGQTQPVHVDLIYTEAERPIRTVLEGKWARHDEQVAIMAAIIREYGLGEGAMTAMLHRSIGVERQEATGERFRLVNADAIEETARMTADSVDLILTSIPFGTQYEYTNSANDLGHTDDNTHFWEQMDYLTPELFRVLRPGRVMAIHVKDRITPSGITKLGFQTVAPFHAEAVFHYIRHGFGYLGMKTITTDVVRENNQTYRLGWTEQCKDGSRMGVGMPEYLLLFRKPPTDRSNGYADTPVMKDKKWWNGEAWDSPDGYSLGAWQIDAHGYERSSGNRLLTPDDLRHLPHEQIYKMFKAFSRSSVYDYRQHVGLCEEMTRHGRLPVTFMLLPPHSPHPDVWTDIARMRTLNMLQERKGREMHLCPMQFDIAERVIVQHSMRGETVLDPFSGIGSVPYMAVKLGRVGVGIELGTSYHVDAVTYCQEAERDAETLDLFTALRAEESIDP